MAVMLFLRMRTANNLKEEEEEEVSGLVRSGFPHSDQLKRMTWAAQARFRFV